MTITTSHPNGHFYSPVVDPAELVKREESIWPKNPVCVGIDFQPRRHEQILREWFPRHMVKFDYPEILEEGPDLKDFYVKNSQFSWLDCRTLFVLLNELKPKRLIEVGSGFSSLLTADVNRRFLGNALEFTCIEPFPRAFLLNKIPGITRLIEAPVQEVDFSEFAKLEAGDILLIDSSHVCKTGSDVTHLYLNVLPRLKPGVIVHIHDIFLPHDYLKEWAITENRSWNEQYLLQAMLTYSARWDVLFANYYAFQTFPELVVEALNHPKHHGFGGGSFWIQVRP